MRKNRIFLLLLCVSFGATFVGAEVVNRVEGDYDGDGRTDIGIAYINTTPSVPNWHIFKTSDSVSGSANPGSATPWSPNWSTWFGYWGASDAVPADYDGDGKTDMALFDPVLGSFHIYRSRYGKVDYYLGLRATVPVIGDWNKDGRADLCTYDGPNGANWRFFLNGGNGVFPAAPSRSDGYGWNGPLPLAGDYDGDGYSDQILHSAALKRWYIRRGSATGPGQYLDPINDESFCPIADPTLSPEVRDFDYSGRASIALKYWCAPAASSGSPRDPILCRYIFPRPPLPPLARGPQLSAVDILTDLRNLIAKYPGKQVKHLDRYLPSVPYGTPPEEIDSQLFALAFADTDCQVLAVGNRTYTLSKPVHTVGRNGLVIRGAGAATTVYSGESKVPAGSDLLYPVTNQVKWGNSAAFAFKDCSNIVVSDIRFVGKSLDRTKSEEVTISVPSGTWTYKTPSLENNSPNARALNFVDAHDIVVERCRFEHYQGAGIYLVNLVDGANFKFSNNILKDCANFRHPKNCYVYSGGSVPYYANKGNEERVFSDDAAIQINSGNVVLKWTAGLLLGGALKEDGISFGEPYVGAGYVGLLKNVEISNNSIYGPLMDGIFVNSLGIYDLRVTGNYVYGNNSAFAQPVLAAERPSKHSSEMGIAVNVSGGGKIAITDNYIAGWGAEGIVVGDWGASYVYPTKDPIVILRNRIFDCGFRGISVQGKVLQNAVCTLSDAASVSLNDKGVVVSTTNKVCNLYMGVRIEGNYFVQTPNSDMTPRLGFDADFDDNSTSPTRVSFLGFRYIGVGHTDSIPAAVNSTNWYSRFGYDGKLTWVNVERVGAN